MLQSVTFTTYYWDNETDTLRHHDITVNPAHVGGLTQNEIDGPLWWKTRIVLMGMAFCVKEPIEEVKGRLGWL